MKRKRGYIHIYTGNGKGKTTAALGMALRAAGAGFTVLIVQFLKGRSYSEYVSLDKLRDRITVKRFGKRCFIRKAPRKADINAFNRGIRFVETALRSGCYDMIVLDEIIIAAHLKLVSAERVAALLDEKTENTELVLTGRYAPRCLIKKADLVTEMKEVKHYYRTGVKARKGIEK
jgi:cob(I)alamin adenosyltransferase